MVLNCEGIGRERRKLGVCDCWLIKTIVGRTEKGKKWSLDFESRRAERQKRDGFGWIGVILCCCVLYYIIERNLVDGETDLKLFFADVTGIGSLFSSFQGPQCSNKARSCHKNGES